MPTNNVPDVTAVRRDTTLRWPCRKGDFILWFRYPGLFATEPQIVDYWEMRDGDSVMITNRYADIPPWFELHPLEVCDSFIAPMMAKLKDGYNPAEVVEGPNVWRLRTGDRVVWVGQDRPGNRGMSGLLSILEIEDCVLALGETNRDGLDAFCEFGAPSTDKPNREDTLRCRVAANAVKAMGTPQSWGESWQIG